jgi:hypothetical protein
VAHLRQGSVHGSSGLEVNHSTVPSNIVVYCYSDFFFCNPLLFAICTSTFSQLCKILYSGM